MQWVKRFCGFLGRKLYLEEIGDIIKKQNYNDRSGTKYNRYFWPTIGVLAEIGFLDKEEGIKGSIGSYQTMSVSIFFDKSENFYTNEFIIDNIFDSGFINFAKIFLKEALIESKIDNAPNLYEIYKQDNSNSLLTTESLETQSYLISKADMSWKYFKQNSERQRKEKFHMATNSGMLKTLKGLESFFTYDPLGAWLG